MIDILRVLAQHLADNGVGTFDEDSGNDIFINKQPPDPDNCVTLVGQPGTTLTTSRDVPELQFPRFQLLVRNTDYDAASRKFQEARSVLHGIVGKRLPENEPVVRILRCHVEQEGGPLGEDEQGRSEISCNFICEFHNLEEES